MLDVSRLQPEARPIVEAAAAIYMRHTEPWFIGLVAHGSALKGGFIPGCSDIDLQLYLEDAAGVSKEQAIALLPLQSAMSQTIRRFHRAVRVYYAGQGSVEQVLEVFESGVAFLQSARAWAEAQGIVA